MSTWIPEQLNAIPRAQVDAWFGFSREAFQGAEKLLNLNLQVSKSALEASQTRVTQLLDAKDPSELVPPAVGTPAFAALFPVNFADVGRQYYQVFAETQSAFAEHIDAHVQAQQAATEEIVSNIARNAPVGSDAAVAAVKSAINSGNAAYESSRKVAKQAAELIEKNIEAVVANAPTAAAA